MLRAAAAAMVGIAALVGSYGAVPGDRADARTRYRVRTEYVADGVRLQKILDRRGPRRIRVLRIDPAAASELEVVLATNVIPYHEPTSSMARRTGAIAAINGDYTILPSREGAGRPVNLFAHDGRLIASPLIWGRNFALTSDELTSYIGHPKLKATLIQEPPDPAWSIPKWNEFPSGRVSAYTPEGGRFFLPPKDACSIRLFRASSLRWQEGDAGLEQDYRVDLVRCSAQRVPRKGGTVVSVPLDQPRSLRFAGQFARDEIVTLEWTTGWPGVLDTIGGNPTLIEDGRMTTYCEGSSFCHRHPRTGVGVTPEGEILLVTVDGRQPRWSVGASIGEFGRLFRFLGASWALNLDGGGSTTMWVRGQIRNRPSGGYERAVGSALVLLRGPDDDEPVPVPAPTPTPSPTPTIVPTVSPTSTSVPVIETAPLLAPFRTGALAPCPAAGDPASVGGLLDALTRGSLGNRVELRGPLASALRSFRLDTRCTARGFPTR